MSDLTSIAKDNLKDVKGFIKNNNYTIIRVEENYCELSGQLTETSFNPYGAVHGGYLFGMADTAAGIAAATSGKAAVTSSSSIEYLRSCKGQKLKAVAKCLKDGKNISVYEVLIYDEEDNLCVRSSMSYFYLDKEI